MPGFWLTGKKLSDRKKLSDKIHSPFEYFGFSNGFSLSLEFLEAALSGGYFFVKIKLILGYNPPAMLDLNSVEELRRIALLLNGENDIVSFLNRIEEEREQRRAQKLAGIKLKKPSQKMDEGFAVYFSSVARIKRMVHHRKEDAEVLERIGLMYEVGEVTTALSIVPHPIEDGEYKGLYAGLLYIDLTEGMNYILCSYPCLVKRPQCRKRSNLLFAETELGQIEASFRIPKYLDESRLAEFITDIFYYHRHSQDFDKAYLLRMPPRLED